ncbi:hypothetical protein D3C78_1259190 [compost metagenome]
MVDKKMMWPSGGDWATNVEAMTSLPPGLFSITTGWPSFADSLVPTSRATASVEPPAANGTTMRIGLVGKSAACATDSRGARARAPARRMEESFIV